MKYLRCHPLFSLAEKLSVEQGQQLLHYNLRYVLILYETGWSTPSEGNQSVPALTPEQSRIVNHRIERNHLIKIVAFAGSGKTTTLLRLTERVNKENPHFRFLLIVYKLIVQYPTKLAGNFQTTSFAEPFIIWLIAIPLVKAY
ncbi:hypothetical protein OUZ56_030103 [Daphnia magna]|uniref:Helicase/UvrB N-terminal domain-containing protein n=1 Tax=Daphnia magna TaxID=35525 RepID=A0ABQ9ZQQ3_9CRUS|nr:hypothetical protein OUZ56_030103 [Daphnia magna]